MIDGVMIRDLVVHADEHGFLYEILKEDWPEFEKFGQAYLTVTYPGVIKGWHYHDFQSDHFCVVKGMCKIVMYDDREGSPTRYELMEVSCGENRQMLVVFPPKLMHGIVPLGNEAVWLLNFPDVKYNVESPDEHRFPHDLPIRRKDGTVAPYEWLRLTESPDLK